MELLQNRAENRMDETTEAQKRGADTGKISLSIFLFGFLVAAYYAFYFYPHQNAVAAVTDLNGFGKLGRHIAAGDGFSLGYGPTLRRAPLYPAFVALIVKIFGNTQPDIVVYRPVIFAQCLMFAFTCLTVWHLGRRLFGIRTGIVAGILCAITPQTVRYVGMTEVETTMGLLIALMALTGLNLYRHPTAANGALFGIVCASASLTKAVALLYLPIFLVICWLHWYKPRTEEEAQSVRNHRPGGKPFAAALGTLVVCLLPWIVRNHIVSGGKFHSISSNGPGEFLRGYVNAQPKYAFLKQDFGGSDPHDEKWDWEANLMEDQLLRQHGLSFFSTTTFGDNGAYQQAEARVNYELQKEKIESAEAKRRLTHEPLAFIRKFVIQLFTFWYIVETKKKSLLVGGISLAALLFAGYGWKQARRNGVDATSVVEIVVYFNLMYAAILALARYSMPVFPVLLVMTAYGVTQAFGGRKDKASGIK